MYENAYPVPVTGSMWPLRALRALYRKIYDCMDNIFLKLPRRPRKCRLDQVIHADIRVPLHFAGIAL